jgi:hypothetical protein
MLGPEILIGPGSSGGRSGRFWTRLGGGRQIRSPSFHGCRKTRERRESEVVDAKIYLSHLVWLIYHSTYVTMWDYTANIWNILRVFYLCYLFTWLFTTGFCDPLEILRYSACSPRIARI